MKLLFAYFDFTANGKGGGYRGFGECGLNFSISHDYKVERVALEGEGAPAYVLSRTEKPVGEKLPEEFWGEHIYNVSAIVGGNGLGKSTLIHCLINALYYEQKEEVSVRCPTLLVFETEDGRERVLCRNVEKGRVSYEPSGGEKPPEITEEYPFDYIETQDNSKIPSVPKLMLFSNTFSSGDVALNRLYKNNDNKDQFFNKSLVASFKHSQEIRSPGELPKGDTDIYWHSDVMFQYESFQEARFVFDPQVREMMTELEKGGFSVPVPKEIRFGARDGLRLFEDWARFCRAHSKGEASAQGQGNGYSELFSAICDKLKPSDSITDNMITYIILVCLVGDDYREHPEKEDAARAGRISEALEKVLDSDNAKENFKKLKKYLGKNNELARSHTKLVNGLVKIGESKEAAKLLTRSEGSDPWCSISLGENSSEVYRLMNELVEKYRAIKGRNYFLVFEWGMSSGEKNMLRMLAQLWYLPSKISETMGQSDANEKALVYNLMNGEMTPCKTLYLFLDEADLTYHPEWQRRFISVLTAVIEKMFPGYGLENIQIILATHSPLMLGDFPAASTIYLKKGDGGMTLVDHERRHSTFGENLYTILDDSFFMNDTIGE
ncbi:MAG: AAA family ATPase, partial [Clostridia bacterium]|nr:AAA family ATPase [Clostridia bacterium]